MILVILGDAGCLHAALWGLPSLTGLTSLGPCCCDLLILGPLLGWVGAAACPAYLY